MRSGKTLAFNMTCEPCGNKFIVQRNDYFNFCCVYCGVKQTQKKIEQVWITVEPCTELKDY